MSRLIRFVKRYPLSLLCVAAIWYLCLLFNAPRTRLNDVPLIDKWVHVAMYLGTCSLIWFEYLRAHRRPQWRRLLTWAVVAPAAMSGLIEWLQANATATRSGDWADFAANCIGIVLAALIYGFFVIKKDDQEVGGDPFYTDKQLKAQAAAKANA